MLAATYHVLRAARHLCAVERAAADAWAASASLSASLPTLPLPPAQVGPMLLDAMPAAVRPVLPAAREPHSGAAAYLDARFFAALTAVFMPALYTPVEPRCPQRRLSPRSTSPSATCCAPRATRRLATLPRGAASKTREGLQMY